MPAVQLGSRVAGTWAEDVTKTVFSLGSSLPFSFTFSLCRVGSVFSAVGTRMPASCLKPQLAITEGLRVSPPSTLESGGRASWFSLCAHSCGHGRERKLGQDFLLGIGGGRVSLKKERCRETVAVLCTRDVKSCFFASFQSSPFLRTSGLQLHCTHC